MVVELFIQRGAEDVNVRMCGMQGVQAFGRSDDAQEVDLLGAIVLQELQNVELQCILTGSRICVAQQSKEAAVEPGTQFHLTI